MALSDLLDNFKTFMNKYHYTKSQSDGLITAHNSNNAAHSDIRNDLNGKVNINQGTNNNGKFLKVSSGNVTCESVTIPDISGKENISNKVTSLSSSSTDTQYPSAKCVYDTIDSINGADIEIQSEIISISNQLHNGVSISNLKYDSKLLNFQLKNLNINKLIEKYWTSVTGLYEWYIYETGEPYPFCLVPRYITYDSIHFEDTSMYDSGLINTFVHDYDSMFEYYNNQLPFIVINAPYDINPPYGIDNDPGISPNNHRMTSQEYQGNINYNEFDDKCWLVIYDFVNETQFVFKPYDEDSIEVVVTYTDNTTETLNLFKKV